MSVETGRRLYSHKGGGASWFLNDVYEVLPTQVYSDQKTIDAAARRHGIQWKAVDSAVRTVLGYGMMGVVDIVLEKNVYDNKLL